MSRQTINAGAIRNLPTGGGLEYEVGDIITSRNQKNSP